MFEKRWLAVFLVTCALGLAVGLGFSQLHVFVTNRTVTRSAVVGLDVCSGVLDILKFDKQPMIYSASYWECLELWLGLSPQKTPWP